MEVGPGTTRIDPGATGRAIVGKVILPDGSFLIEDVPPGTFEMVIFIHKKRFGRNEVGDIRLASGRRGVVVPSEPGNPRLDLGTIRLEASKP